MEAVGAQTISTQEQPLQARGILDDELNLFAASTRTPMTRRVLEVIRRQ
jgi:hypothetical protein